MNPADRPVLIMAGGTGGHIFPGLALASELTGRGVGVRWLGARGGMECQQVPAQGIAMDAIDIAGVRGKGLGGWLALPFRLWRGVRDAVKVMRRHDPVCAISFGGYAAGPGGIAARVRGIPLIVHEQNRIPGMTNRFLARIAAQVFQAFPGTFPAARSAHTCGNPVRASVAALPAPDARFQSRQGRARLLITGGSQGAASLNRCLPAALALVAQELRPDVLHQAGTRDLEATRQAYVSAGVDAEVVEFIEDMAGAYARADLVVCRAGALTVSELAVAGVGALLVPYPHAVDDHQTLNAAVLESAGAAIILQERAMDARSLAAVLAPLLGNRSEMLAMARAARDVAVPGAAGALADACAAYLASASGVGS
jgi:UDP-N-acetylglucosamine--N-acetylmuramyl-(pentapeptide) pyrophosphoryl-undecaprenol N-acetylglucosamine transferase